ncbi:MAG: tetratricopeptide repeat protein [Firmicutes bacterium]|nr:tetratricopeptide repeat protein [Bacillota bacterium]
MALDRTKVQKQAESYLANGKIEKAIDEFLKLLDDKADDYNLANRVGDAYLQIGRVDDALAMFKRAGSGYERSGFTNKAAAVFKKAHRTVPDDVDVALRLAEAYRATNMIKDAMQVHIAVADIYSKKGLKKRALEEFSKVVELEPNNPVHKVKLADLYNKEGMKDRAVDIYLEVAESLAFEQRSSEASQILERAKAMTTAPKLFLTQCKLRVVQNDLPGAIQHLREGLAVNARSIELLEVLAETELKAKAPERALEALAQIPQLPEKGVAVCERALREMVRSGAVDEGMNLFKPIGRDLSRRGMGEQAARILRGAFSGQGLPLSAWLQMADIAQQSGDRAGRVEALSQARRLAEAAQDGSLMRSLDADLQGLGVQGTVLESLPSPVVPPSMLRPEPAASQEILETTEVDPIRRMQIQQLQREAEALTRSRSHERALDAYQKILDLDPLNLAAIDGIAEVHRTSGVMTRVQQHYVKMAEKMVAMEQRSMAIRMLDKAEELFPGSTRLHRRMLGLLGPAAPPPVPAKVEPVLEPVSDLDLSIVELQDELPTAIALGAGEPVAEPLPTESLSDLDVLIALDQTGAGVPSSLSVPSIEPAGTDTVPLPGIEEVEPLELEPLSFLKGIEQASPPSEDLLAVLSDIDFQLDYGSPEEARNEIRTALETWPQHPDLCARLDRAEEILRRLSPAPKTLGEEDFSDTFFDLTDVLGSSLDEGEEMHDATHVVEKIQSVDELFNAFREGVEQQVKGDDYDTHYNLGIAYKEMMLIEPAIEEFKKAMRDPERTLECCSMLSICEQAQGNLEGAVAWLRKGIDAPGFPPEDAIGLHYDLGEILAQMGRGDEAKDHYRIVRELDSDYREVAQRA